jgi:hypothetical protein
MGKYEMRQIDSDTRWSEELWGGETIEDATAKVVNGDVGMETSVRPRLYFYWGGNDHWVAEETRDTLIRTRGRSGTGKDDEGKPVMEIDSYGTPHGFCVTEDGSKVVAGKVAEYVEEIVKSL